MARESAQRKMTEFESMCAVYHELATPGAPHKLLAGMAGTWNVTVSVSRDGADLGSSRFTIQAK